MLRIVHYYCFYLIGKASFISLKYSPVPAKSLKTPRNSVSCIIIISLLCALLSLQSQEILNRQVCVLDILKSVWKLLKILKRFWTDSENCWKFWTHSEHYWKLLKILNITENSEHCWKFWTDSEHCWKFWTDSENSEQILNIIFHLKSIYFTSFSLDFN